MTYKKDKKSNGTGGAQKRTPGRTRKVRKPRKKGKK